jgi:excisionase family DNA binding protein
MTDRPDLAAFVADRGQIATAPVEAILAAVVELHALQSHLLARLSERPHLPSPLSRRRPWLRVEEAAAEYGISTKTLYEWIYKRRVTSKKLGPARRDPVLIPRAELERLATTRHALRRSRLDGQ